MSADWTLPPDRISHGGRDQRRLRLPLACAGICLAMIGLGRYMITDGSGV